jgi:hypothetical protein
MSKGAVQAAAPLLIEDANLSWAWARIVMHIKAHAGKNISPLVVSISGFGDHGAPCEDPDLRRELDALLAQHDEWDIETVAFTIFPERIWRIAGGDRKKLFDYYRRAFPRYQAMDRRLNGKGLYFERLTMFGGGPNGGNQLEHILETCTGRKGVRDTMLQAAVFDPRRDHTKSAQLGFPCMQHVSFVPTRDGLVTNAFYATQQLFEKAYGNYLGLARLGAFMARELGMKLVRLNVYVGVAKLEGIPKTDATLAAILTAARARMDGGAA